MRGFSQVSPEVVADWANEARATTLDLVADLSDEQFNRVPLLRIINPFLWEIGHVAYFQEYWVLRHANGHPPLLEHSDDWYDSARIPHDDRWHLPLPSRAATQDYLRKVRDLVLARLDSPTLDEREIYFILLSIFHEDMHDEAFAITRQTLGYAPPQVPTRSRTRRNGDVREIPSGDASIPGGTYMIGAPENRGFVFDNEKWAHPVELPSFHISRLAVTQSEYRDFVEHGGYETRSLWSAEGWTWRQRENASQPVYWQKRGQEWLRRHFNEWIPLEPSHPVSNISWFEAEAYCRWARRRLPTELEWEVAAAGIAADCTANLDWSTKGCCSVLAHSGADSKFGCRQMIGNVWEWTASDFLPYPGFSADSYKEYSQPWFATHKTLRGGSWATRPRLINSTYRNFYTPDRRDIWAGFRTCALRP
jgi:iron(II)-dependent oxidoreductase